MANNHALFGWRSCLQKKLSEIQAKKKKKKRKEKARDTSKPHKKQKERNKESAQRVHASTCHHTLWKT